MGQQTDLHASQLHTLAGIAFGHTTEPDTSLVLVYKFSRDKRCAKPSSDDQDSKCFAEFSASDSDALQWNWRCEPQANATRHAVFHIHLLKYISTSVTDTVSAMDGKAGWFAAVLAVMVGGR